MLIYLCSGKGNRDVPLEARCFMKGMFCSSPAVAAMLVAILRLC